MGPTQYAACTHNARTIRGAAIMPTRVWPRRVVSSALPTTLARRRTITRTLLRRLQNRGEPTEADDDVVAGYSCRRMCLFEDAQNVR